MMLSRIGWTVWALVPIVGLAFHYGPGQQAYREDQASRILEEAERAQAEAVAAQDAAYETHLAAIKARMLAFGSDDPMLLSAAKGAGEVEDAAYAKAAKAWQKTAEVLSQAQPLMSESAPEVQQRVRLARDRAIVRSGDVGTGADDLEDLLEAMAQEGRSDSSVGLQAREELATAYYYGARLMRMAGKPGEEWRAISGRARQNFRYLAEHAAAKGAKPETVKNHEKNGELVLNLEQSSLDEVYAKARPKDSPPGAGNRLGNRPGPRGRGRRRGTEPGNGAGLDGEIGEGW